jgi:PAS domain S-box-containing protein
VSTERQSAGLRILVAEDDGMVAEAICERLTDAGYEVVARPDTGAGAVEAALTLRPDVILMDVRLKGEMDGIRASELINEKMRVPVVYLTGDSDQKTLNRAKTASAYGYVLKPFHLRNLVVAIQVAVDRFEMEQRLEDSQLTYATILSSIADGVIAVDTQGRVRFMNAVAERLTGWLSREAQQDQWHTVLSTADSSGEQIETDMIARALSSRATISLGNDAFAISREGIKTPVDVCAACVVDGLGRVVGATITLRDVTDMRKAESDLRAMAQQLRAVVDTAADGVLMHDAAGTILMLNPACERQFGYTSGEMVGLTIDTIMPSPLPTPNRIPHFDDSESHGPMVVAARATVCRRRDRSTFPAEISIGEACYPGQSLFVVIVHDVSKRRELESAVLDAVRREQRRFGTDLHDGLGQDLTGLSLLLSALAKTARAADSPLAADLEQAREVTQHALDSCRTIAQGLSPFEPTEDGLVGALRDLVTRLKGQSGPHVDISVSEVSRLGLSPSVSDHLYRIAQEAVSNALKHAHANSIKIALDVEQEHVRLEISDDGRGVNDMDRKVSGLGLRTMQYRATMIGAHFEIQSIRPNGTRVICDFPRAG